MAWSIAPSDENATKEKVQATHEHNGRELEVKTRRYIIQDIFQPSIPRAPALVGNTSATTCVG
ncbi:hypothetical protein Patl1_33328 [Pistacia atlantica]|uniref:Uncharacterized protein n=1 Tax=Pistacia atlantica TaxID=434234 RepID=A0ACC0ZUU6_9ROSI|nr:hypothetical protein Patl1_33328 [Pistacia atlantica]